MNVIARISNGDTSSSVDEVREPVREHPGLARAGAGDDEHRARRQRHRLVLGRVQTREQRLELSAGIARREGWARIVDRLTHIVPIVPVRITRVSGLEQQGHRAVVDQRDLHVGAEAAGRDRHAQLGQRLRERLDSGSATSGAAAADQPGAGRRSVSP